MKPNLTAIVESNMGDIIGQSLAKERIADSIVGGHLQDGYSAPMGIFGPAGLGKSHLLRAAKGIFKGIWGAERKTVFCESGDELGSPTNFWETILIPHVAHKPVCFIIDEFHKANKSVQDMFRLMIEISVDRRPKFIRQGRYELTIDPLMHSFIIATNKIDRLDTALLSRLDRVDLALYSDDEMEGILFQGMHGQKIRFMDNTARSIAECNRGSARDIVKWIDAIRLHLALAGKDTLNKKDVAAIIKKRETFPLGVSRNELNTLLLLEKHGEQQMKELAAKNLCDAKEQNANERYLLQRGLMTIDGKRKITREGRDYLATLRDDDFIAEAGKPANEIIEVA